MYTTFHAGTSNHPLRSLFELGNDRTLLLPLQGMRGCAALIVFFVHFHSLMGSYANHGSPLWTISAVLGKAGGIGVDVFFVISGFLIYGMLLSRETTVAQFVCRRVERLYPAFLVVFAIALLGQNLPGHTSKLPVGPASLASYLLLNLLMLPGILDIPPLIAVAWSLSYELSFYVLVAVFANVVRLRRWRPVSRLLFFTAVTALLFGLTMAHLFPRPRMIMFTAGILLWELVYGERLLSTVRASLEPFVIGLFGCVFIQRGVAAAFGPTILGLQVGPPNQVVVFVSTGLLCLYGLFGNGTLTRLFSCEWLCWIGNGSYSFYLCHGFAIHALLAVTRSVIGEQPVSAPAYLLLLALGLIMALTTAAALFLLVEKPFAFRSRKQKYVTISRNGLSPFPPAGRDLLPTPSDPIRSRAG